jgi:hypothetical protein
MHSKMHCFSVLTYERAHTRAFENFGPSGVLGVEDTGGLWQGRTRSIPRAERTRRAAGFQQAELG